jgi:hypothetical protein
VRLSTLTAAPSHGASSTCTCYGDIASERGLSALDTFLDIALANDLRTCFVSAKTDNDDDDV